MAELADAADTKKTESKLISVRFRYPPPLQSPAKLTAPSLILDMPDLPRRRRTNWQQGLHEFRNDFLEHRKNDAARFDAYYQPKTVEMLFDHAWRTIAELLPAFIEARYPATWSI